MQAVYNTLISQFVKNQEQDQINNYSFKIYVSQRKMVAQALRVLTPSIKKALDMGYGSTGFEKI